MNAKEQGCSDEGYLSFTIQTQLTRPENAPSSPRSAPTAHRKQHWENSFENAAFTVSCVQSFGLRRCKQRAHVGKKAGIVQLCEHALFRLGTGNPEARLLEILTEERHHIAGVQTRKYVESVGLGRPDNHN
jgi:hypothetical protein